MRQYDGVTGVAPFIHAEGMLSQGAIVSGTLIRGVLPSQEGEVSQLGDKMLAGKLENLQAGEFGIILGKDLALTMRAGMGDKVTLITPQASVTAVGILPRLKRFTVVGVFEIGMYEYDSALALLHIEDASRLFRLDGGVTGVRINMDDMFAAPQLTRELLNELPLVYSASDWTRQHATFFRGVQ